MKNSVKTYLVDSFTNELFKGNPAGVCLLKSSMTEQQMGAIAKELAYSETAFVQKISEPNKYTIRFFSPVMKIPLCGHATLASGKVLFDRDKDLKEIQFVNIQDLEFKVKRKDDLIQINFPIYETIPSEAPPKLLHALGIKKINAAVFNKETNILMLEIEDSQALRNLNPDFVALKEAHDTINGVLVTAKSTDVNYDFESRYFWPWSGTNEDPVTGATHTFLAKYWSRKLNKSKMKSFQCSNRTGFMDVELIDDQNLIILGAAQIVLKGKLFFENN